MKNHMMLLPGESPLVGAPNVTLENGASCIPQHYLTYRHDRDSVESILLDIEYSDRFPVFVGEDGGVPYIQVGVIGYDNYRPLASQPEMKIVYGRKWRVEPNLPTSELIQTVFLALQKAREHEVRERFKLKRNGKTTTPFSTHHDLPLMANHVGSTAVQTEDSSEDIEEVQSWLSQLSFDSATLHCLTLTRHRSHWLMDVEITPGSDAQLPENCPRVETLLLDALTFSSVCRALMSLFLDQSNGQVAENFRFKGFARFSKSLPVTYVSELSSLTRAREAQASTDEFSERFSESNYTTDQTRAPQLDNSLLSQRLRLTLQQFDQLSGVLPY